MDRIDIPSPQQRSLKASRKPPKHESQDLSENGIPIRRAHNRMDKLTLTRRFWIEVLGWNGLISIHTDTKEGGSLLIQTKAVPMG